VACRVEAGLRNPKGGLLKVWERPEGGAHKKAHKGGTQEGAHLRGL